MRKKKIHTVDVRFHPTLTEELLTEWMRYFWESYNKTPDEFLVSIFQAQKLAEDVYGKRWWDKRTKANKFFESLVRGNERTVFESDYGVSQITVED